MFIGAVVGFQIWLLIILFSWNVVQAPKKGGKVAAPAKKKQVYAF